MQIFTINLKDYYPFLGKNNLDPTITAYLPYNLKEMGWETRKRPTIIVCPGGGYGFCSEREAEPIALKYVANGFNAFVIDYSVAPAHFPTQVTEIAATLELIYENQNNWNVDTNKIAIIGFSAGGHIAAHYSNVYNCEKVRQFFPNSKPVNATILSYPVITSNLSQTHVGTILNVAGKTPETEQEFNFFSCDKQVSKNTPPTFIWHTAEDAIVPVENSLLYASALAKNKVPFELHIYPLGVHGLSVCDSTVYNKEQLSQATSYNKNWLEHSLNWLKLTFQLD